MSNLVCVCLTSDFARQCESIGLQGRVGGREGGLLGVWLDLLCLALEFSV